MGRAACGLPDSTARRVDSTERVPDSTARMYELATCLHFQVMVPDSTSQCAKTALSGHNFIEIIVNRAHKMGIAKLWKLMQYHMRPDDALFAHPSDHGSVFIVHIYPIALISIINIGIVKACVIQ